VNNILAVPFKGPLAAEQIYGDVGLRTYCDLDIFIKKQDAIKAKALLTENGYKADIELPPEKENKYFEFENSFSFYNTGGSIPIDLHWEMTGRYLLKPIYLDQIENDLETLDFMGHEILAIPHDLMLIYLCLHGTSHCWERLEWLYGFSEMVQQQQTNLFNVLNLAAAMGCKRMLYLGLELSRELFKAKIPQKVSDEIESDPGIAKAAKKIKFMLFSRKICKSDDAEWRFSPLHISLRDSYRDRLRYFLYLYTAPTVKEWSRLPLPSCITPLYRILRPIRLGTAYLTGRKGNDA
jgi:hypothetical protein